MYMTDVMTKLKEIVESGYESEDVQRGINAAAIHKFDEVRGKIHENVSDDIKLSAQKLAQVAGNKTAELMIKIVTDAKEKFPQLKGKDTLVGGVPQHQHELVSFLDNLRKEVDNAIAEKSIDGFERRSYEYMGNLKELGLDLGVYKLFNRIEAMLEESIAEEFVEAAADEVIDEAEVAEEEDAVEEVHEDVEEDTSLADMLKLAGRSGVMGLSQNNIIAESLELDEEDDLEEAYINTSKDAIDTLGELRKIGKSIERGQGEYEGNLANKYANDVYDVISWVENNLDKYEPNYKKVEGPVIELLKKAKGMERQTGSGKDARFGNEIVNTLYPLMQWIEMNAHGSGVKEVEEEAIDEAEMTFGTKRIPGAMKKKGMDKVKTKGLNKDKSSAAYIGKMKKAEDELDEAEVEETVEVPVSALSELMRLAGYEDYEAKIDEYENDPEEEYMDAEDQLVGLSGGLNGPKGMYPTAAGGDNAMAVSALKVKEDTLSFESFYKKYQEFVTEEK